MKKVEELLVGGKAVEKCLEGTGCTRIKDGRCTMYSDPSVRWKYMGCAGYHIVFVDPQKSKFINPIKQSKKGWR